ncbi:hypothetical protein [Clostridium baratii]|uniref:hypothetical protein n=1 Tax=Clostridium baratii TaxID=1561 RepID=UPI0030D1524B
MKRILNYRIDPYDNGNMHLGYVSRNDTVYLNIDVESLEKDANDITINVLGKKSNGTLVEQKGNDNIRKEENIIKIKLKDSFVSTDGIVNLNIYLKDDEGAVTYIAPYFYVDSTIEGDIVEDKYTIDTLEEIKREAEQLIKKVDDKLNGITSGGGSGKTWRPSVSEDGLLSWSEDNSDIPPESVNIIGPQGRPGIDGKDGRDGIDGKQGVAGENGVTPHIGDNDNWFIGIQDTGVPARGKDGRQGPPGRDGEIGPQGLPGRDGEVGPVGPQGIPGLNGRDGEQGPKGDNGITPHIGDNGNWFIGSEDTGRPSRGRDGEIGPQGPKGEDGTFNPNTEFDNLNTNDKTVIGAINEVKENVESISTDDFATKEKIEGQAEVLNGWKLTGNKINKLTKFNIGFTVFEFQVTAVQEIAAGTVCFMIPPEFTPAVSFMPINISIGSSMGNGFIYKNGQVKFNGTYSKGAIVTGSCIIINKC